MPKHYYQLILSFHIFEGRKQQAKKTNGTYHGVETYLGDMGGYRRGKGKERKIGRLHIQWLSVYLVIQPRAS